LGNLFPVVSAPSLFVFTGNVSLKSEVAYWEDPRLEAADLSFERIEELVTSDWAYQDNSTNAWVKGWTKRVSRFGTGSFIGFIVVILLPLVFCGLCCLCCKELMTSDENADGKQEEIKRTLQQPPPPSKNNGVSQVSPYSNAPVQQRRLQDSGATQAQAQAHASLIKIRMQEEREKLERERALIQEEWAKLEREKDEMKKRLQQQEPESAGDPPEETMEDSVAQDDGLTKRR